MQVSKKYEPSKDDKKLDEETYVRPLPKDKPPRRDRRRYPKPDDPDLDQRDPDLSMNFKDIGAGSEEPFVPSAEGDRSPSMPNTLKSARTENLLKRLDRIASFIEKNPSRIRLDKKQAKLFVNEIDSVSDALEVAAFGKSAHQARVKQAMEPMDEMDEMMMDSDYDDMDMDDMDMDDAMDETEEDMMSPLGEDYP
jgi:hypothetical protein